MPLFLFFPYPTPYPSNFLSSSVLCFRAPCQSMARLQGSTAGCSRGWRGASQPERCQQLCGAAKGCGRAQGTAAHSLPRASSEGRVSAPAFRVECKAVTFYKFCLFSETSSSSCSRVGAELLVSFSVLEVPCSLTAAVLVFCVQGPRRSCSYTIQPSMSAKLCISSFSFCSLHSFGRCLTTTYKLEVGFFHAQFWVLIILVRECCSISID